MRAEERSQMGLSLCSMRAKRSSRNRYSDARVAAKGCTRDKMSRKPQSNRIWGSCTRGEDSANLSPVPLHRVSGWRRPGVKRHWVETVLRR